MEQEDMFSGTPVVAGKETVADELERLDGMARTFTGAQLRAWWETASADDRDRMWASVIRNRPALVDLAGALAWEFPREKGSAAGDGGFTESERAILHREYLETVEDDIRRGVVKPEEADDYRNAADKAIRDGSLEASVLAGQRRCQIKPLKTGDVLGPEAGFWAGAEVISVYTRADAIEDGTLVDVSDTSEAKEAGFKWPVALTRAAYTKCVEVPQGCEGVQDVKGRLWDVMHMLRCMIRMQPGAVGDSLAFKVSVVTGLKKGGKGHKRETVKLMSRVGPGDTGEPVITIRLAEESED